MGSTAYPVKFSDTRLSDVQSRLLSQPIDIYVPIGTVSVTASREGIEYNLVTISKLIGKLNELESLLLKDVKDKINQCVDLFDARNKIEGIIDSIGDSLVRTICLKFEYKGVDISDFIHRPRFNLNNDGYTVVTCTKNSVRKKPITTFYHYDTTTFFHVDKPNTRTRAIAYQPVKQDSKLIIEGDLQKFKDCMGMSDDKHIVMTSTLPVPPKVIKTASGKIIKKYEFSTYTPNTYYFSSSYDVKREVDTTQPFYYATKDELSPKHNIFKSYYHKCLNQSNIFGNFPQIFIIPDKSKIDKTNGINFVVSFFPDYIKSLKGKYPNYLNSQTIYLTSRSKQNVQAIIKKYPTWRDGLDVLNFKANSDKDVGELISLYEVNTTVNTSNIVDKFYEKYQLIDFEAYNLSINNHLLTYLKLVEKGTI